MSDHKWKPWSEGGPGCSEKATSADSSADVCNADSEATTQARILAPESTWREPVEWDGKAKVIETGGLNVAHKPRVLVDPACDLFQPFAGRWDGRDEDGRVGELWINWGERPYTTADALSRVFSLIDETPKLEWVIPTSHPERVCCRDGSMAGCGGTGDCPWFTDCGSPLPKRDNVTLAVRVSTQAECTFDRCEAALACSDLVGKVMLFAEPRERMQLPLAGFDGVIIDPSNYAYSKPLVDQCEAAGVDYDILEGD